jgi:hypothetical protein
MPLTMPRPLVALLSGSALAIAFLAVSVAPAIAGQAGNVGGKSGSLTTTIAFSPETQTEAVASSSERMVYGDAIFTVTRSYPYDKDTIWVTNRCWDAAGIELERRDNPVLWGTSISLVGTTWPFPTAGVRCTAYVTLRPWQNRPLGDAIVNYFVAL